MALPGRLLPQRALHTRRSNVLVTDKTFPFTTALAHALETDGLVQLNAVGLAAPLNVDITGTLAGVGTTETVVVPFPGSGLTRSVKRYSTLTQLRVDETQAGTLTAKAVTSGGAPLFAMTTVDAAMPCRLTVRRLTEPDIDPQGNQILERYMLYTNTTTVLPGDRMAVDGIQYEVEHAPVVYGRAKHHSELRVRRIS